MSTGSAFLDWVNQTLFNLFPEQEEVIHHEMMVEYGIEEPTPAEAAAIEREEDANYNKHISAAAWWAGSNTFVDRRGNVRDVNSHEIIIPRCQRTEIPVYKRLQG